MLQGTIPGDCGGNGSNSIGIKFELVETCSDSCEIHSSESGDRGKRTSDLARTQALCSIAEIQPREPPISVHYCDFSPVQGGVSIRSLEGVMFTITVAHYML